MIVLLMAALVVVSGCALLGGGKTPPDERYGHRYVEAGPDGYHVLALAPPDSGRAYFQYPAPVEEVVVRTAPADPPTDTSTVPAEVLIKGVLPETCMALSRATQRRAGHLIEVALTARMPEAATCERARRPYRFYLPLEGRFAEGAYTLLLNGEAYPFTVSLDG